MISGLPSPSFLLHGGLEAQAGAMLLCIYSFLSQIPQLLMQSPQGPMPAQTFLLLTPWTTETLLRNQLLPWGTTHPHD